MFRFLFYGYFDLLGNLSGFYRNGYCAFFLRFYHTLFRNSCHLLIRGGVSHLLLGGDGEITGFKVRLLPFFRVSFVFNPVILVVFTFALCTFTFKVAFLPLFKVMVIFALPVFLPALILPFLSTVTIFLLLEVQDFTEPHLPDR